MKHSFFQKLFGGAVIFVVALTSIVLYFSYTSTRNHSFELITGDLYRIAQAITPSINPLYKERKWADLDAFLKRIGPRITTRVTLIDAAGMVLADSHKNPALMENHQDRPEIQAAFIGRSGIAVRYSRTLKKEMVYVAIPLQTTGRPTAVIRVSIFSADMYAVLHRLRTTVGFIGLIMVLLALIGAFIFSRSIMQPLGALSRAAERVAAGDFKATVALNQYREFKGVGERFNHMARQINQLVMELRKQKEDLYAVIASLDAGLAVIDKQDRIVLCNERFKTIVKEPGLEGKTYWEMIRNKTLDEIITSVRTQKKTQDAELEIQGALYLYRGSYLPADEAVLLTLQDITHVKQLEQMKRDFVTNVSHELRTPLTAIKGFAETLSEEVPEKQRQYVDTIQRHTDRMINIVEDLLMLSQLEEQGFALQPDDLVLSDVLQSVQKMFEPRLREKNLSLHIHIREDFPVFKADPFKIEQVFINLVDNAIKYTEHGSIDVHADYTPDQVVIKISDTGIGIDHWHLSRIFERFYVVDKSRSRRSGGTGLGLSIVKHIILAHNGTIQVESKPGMGTTFIISLPRLA